MEEEAEETTDGVTIFGGSARAAYTITVATGIPVDVYLPQLMELCPRLRHTRELPVMTSAKVSDFLTPFHLVHIWN